MAPPSSSILTVAQLVSQVKVLVNERLGEIQVEGELSNFKRASSGHCYFTLKDRQAQLRCVLWRPRALQLSFQPLDGMQVQIEGGINVYEPRGELQLVATSMKLAGEGALQKAFEQLKARLNEEGLFQASTKKRLPRFPETIGLITSGTGAAVQDMLSILERRYPQVRVLVCSVQVQGAGAAAAISEAILAFNALDPEDDFLPDLLIVGRGGGSAEDLWAFNEEPVVRAIYDSVIPIISAVGHETDVTLSDFAADVRAATPSMGAELAVPDRRDITAQVLGAYQRLQDITSRQVQAERKRIAFLIGSFGMKRPVELMRRYTQRVDELSTRLDKLPAHLLEKRRTNLFSIERNLKSLDPRRPLNNGYVLVKKENHYVYKAEALESGDQVQLEFVDGIKIAKIV